MPIANPEKYAQMIDAAKAGSYAFPAINITSSQTLNAALAGFAEAGSDGIIQISSGGAEYASGPTIKDKVTGSVALAEYAHVVAKNYPINIAVHTDHCQKDKIDTWVKPLIAISQERVDAGKEPLNGWIALILYLLLAPALWAYIQSSLNTIWEQEGDLA